MRSTVTGICSVCNIRLSEAAVSLYRRRSSSLVCPACSKFFRRNHKNLDSLRCSSGRSDCDVSSYHAADTAMRYPTCRRCRLIKCFMAGMKHKGDRVVAESKTNNWETKLSVEQCKNDFTTNKLWLDVDQSPVMIELRQLENALTYIVKTSDRFKVLGTYAPFLFHKPKTSGDADAFNSFHHCAVMTREYFEQIAEFASLTVRDKYNLLAKAFAPILLVNFVAASCYSIGIMQRNMESYLARSPAFKEVGECIVEISLLFESWKPSHAEIAVLQAFLFFQIDLLLTLEKPNRVLEGNRKVSVVLTGLVNRSENPDKKLHYFNRAHKLLLEFRQKYKEALVHFCYIHADLVYRNKLAFDLADMSDTERQYRSAALATFLDHL